MEARNNADYVIVIVHGGHEFYQLPSPRMQKLYRHFIDLGADAVINHHQHCYSGYEEYKGKHIIYGLGNLCFDWGCNSGQKWVEGYMITLNIKPDTTTISLHPYIQCQEKASILIMDQESSDNFHEKIENLNEIINNDLKLHEAYSQYVNNHRSRIIRLFSSYHNRYLNAAVKRGLLPQLTNRKELLSIMNYITCEAHRDVTINVLNDFLHHKL